jgi:hypothetical protein
MYVYLKNGQRHYFHSCLICQSNDEAVVTVGDVIDQRQHYHQMTPFDVPSAGEAYAEYREE